jgi:hypothetical protein
MYLLPKQIFEVQKVVEIQDFTLKNNAMSRETVLLSQADCMTLPFSTGTCQNESLLKRVGCKIKVRPSSPAQR